MYPALFYHGIKAHAQVLSCSRTEETTTLFLLGDSTVANQHDEAYASWGQLLSAFIQPGMAVANHAQSGETLKTFISSLRLAKILESVRPGDYALIQFGHNDQKEAWPQSYLPAETGFKAWLHAYIAEFRLRGVQVLLLTSPERLSFDKQGKIVPSHGKYPDVVRALAREEQLPLLDLEKASRALYEGTGEEKAETLFAPKDRTHHNLTGAYALAELLAAELYTFIPESRPTAETSWRKG